MFVNIDGINVCLAVCLVDSAVWICRDRGTLKVGTLNEESDASRVMVFVRIEKRNEERADRRERGEGIKDFGHFGYLLKIRSRPRARCIATFILRYLAVTWNTCSNTMKKPERAFLQSRDDYVGL